MILVLVGVLVFPAACRRDSEKERREEMVDVVARRAEQLLQDQQQNDQRIWLHEIEALRHEAGFWILVDRLRYSRDRWAVLKTIAFDSLNFQQPGRAAPLPWGVEERLLDGGWTRWDVHSWRQWIDELSEAGWSIDYFSLRLKSFSPPTPASDGVAAGVAALEVHAKRTLKGEEPAAKVEHHTLTGEITMSWGRPRTSEERIGPLVGLSVEDLRWRRSEGEQGFREVRRYAVGMPENREPVRITPMLLRDLDGDRRPEIILGG